MSIYRGVLSLVATLLAVSVIPAAAQTRYTVDLPLEAGRWERLSRIGDARVSVLEYVPVGETGADWSRFVSIQVYSAEAVPFPGAGAALNECRVLLTARCPGAAWRVLREGPDDQLYEWSISGCPLEPDQHEVGRIIGTPGAWARMTFSVKGTMDAGTRTEWIRRLEAARLVAVER